MIEELSIGYLQLFPKIIYKLKILKLLVFLL